MAVVIALVALAGLLLSVWFISLESRNERHTILCVLAIVLLVEAVLAGPASKVPQGILRPSIGGQDFRPVDAVIVAALFARALMFRAGIITKLQGAWSTFIAIYVTGIVIGLLNGLSPQVVFYQGKAAFYIAGGAIIASGVDFDRLYDSLGTVARWLAVLVPISTVFSLAGIRIAVSTPVQRFNGLGRLSNDTVTLLVLLGAATLIVEVTRKRRPSVVVAGLVLLFAPLAASQRASYLVLAAVILAFSLVLFGATWKRRTSVTPLEVGLTAAALVGLALGGLVLTASPDVVLKPIEEAFGGAAETRSAASRFDLASQAISKTADSPIIGHGVGTQVVRQGLYTSEFPAAAHNVVLDLAMRVGFVGLVAFLVALVLTISSAVQVWRRAKRTSVAAISLAAAIAVVGIVSKGMVEPALDKFRLSLPFGIAIGLIIAGAEVLHREQHPPAAAGVSSGADVMAEQPVRTRR